MDPRLAETAKTISEIVNQLNTTTLHTQIKRAAQVSKFSVFFVQFQWQINFKPLFYACITFHLLHLIAW